MAKTPEATLSESGHREGFLVAASNLHHDLAFTQKEKNSTTTTEKPKRLGSPAKRKATRDKVTAKHWTIGH